MQPLPISHAGGPARIVYLGTPEIAVAPLRALVDAGHDIALVVTNPDRRRGRGKELMATPVKAAAIELGLAVSHDVDDLLDVDVDFGVVVAFGHILRDHILAKLPLVNIHFSLLPRWRGAAPLERAILAGDEHTGACLMQIAPALDEGAVYAQRSTPIGSSTLDELRDRLVELSCRLLVDTIETGFGVPTPQQGEPVYARKLTAEDHRLDLNTSAAELSRLVRLGRAFTTIDGARLRVHAASPQPFADGESAAQAGTLWGTRLLTADGALELERVQPEGRKAVDAKAWANGARLAPGAVLGQ